jgi:hypothetical protein
MWDLNLSTHEVAHRAKDHGWANCEAKKVSQIVNCKRGILGRQELVALSRALDTTAFELTSGLGELGEPVILLAPTAPAHAVAPSPDIPAPVGSP